MSGLLCRNRPNLDQVVDPGIGQSQITQYVARVFS
jgi:hypothetical protein